MTSTRAWRAASRFLAGCSVVAITAAMTLAVSSGPAGAGSPDLPPAKFKKLAKRFDPVLEPYGVQLSRGLLQDLDTYRPDPRGTHLALYVEPIDADYASARYIENFTALTREFVPKVFDKWEDLESFDICQEPYNDTRESPPPVTQIFLTRDALDRVGDWRKAELSELIAASPRVRNVAAGYFVYFAPSLRTDPTFAAAAREAGWTDPTDFDT